MTAELPADVAWAGITTANESVRMRGRIVIPISIRLMRDCFVHVSASKCERREIVES
jgi:hypothetical protein